MKASASDERLSTGVSGLDEILHGGLLPGRAYLIRGGPGAGKTTLGLHFLIAGAQRGEKALFITLEEEQEDLLMDGARSGMNLEGVDFLDLSPGSDYFAEVQTYDIFAPAEVEREPLTSRIIAAYAPDEFARRVRHEVEHNYAHIAMSFVRKSTYIQKPFTVTDLAMQIRLTLEKT